MVERVNSRSIPVLLLPSCVALDPLSSLRLSSLISTEAHFLSTTHRSYEDQKMQQTRKHFLNGKALIYPDGRLSMGIIYEYFKKFVKKMPILVQNIKTHAQLFHNTHFL